jgi:hypothetical protein
VRLWRAAVSPRLRSRIGEGTAAVRAQVGPLLARLRGWSAEPLSDITYYLGFLTTALVLVAWVINLYFKPHATIFGGGITALGVAIAAAHYQYLKRRGEPAVFLNVPSPTPDSWLVVLSPISNNSKTVIQAVVRRAHGRPLVFLYLAPQSLMEEPPRLFELTIRFGEDRNAQRALSFAKREATAHQINAKYLYAIGGAQQVFDIARRVRPDEIVAEEHTAKRISHAAPSEAGMAVSPEYVRYQHADGMTIAHNVLHELYTRPSGPGTAVGGLRASPPTRSSPPAKSPKGNSGSGGDGSASGPASGRVNPPRERSPGADGKAEFNDFDPSRGESPKREDLGDE